MKSAELNGKKSTLRNDPEWSYSLLANLNGWLRRILVFREPHSGQNNFNTSVWAFEGLARYNAAVNLSIIYSSLCKLSVEVQTHYIWHVDSNYPRFLRFITKTRKVLVFANWKFFSLNSITCAVLRLTLLSRGNMPLAGTYQTKTPRPMGTKS